MLFEQLEKVVERMASVADSVDSKVRGAGRHTQTSMAALGSLSIIRVEMIPESYGTTQSEIAESVRFVGNRLFLSNPLLVQV